MTKDECILFTGYIQWNGYGQRWCPEIQARTTAHRAAWIKKYGAGSIPPGSYVLHACDILYTEGDIIYRRCINTDHLQLGTQQDNIDHMWLIGRGSRHGLQGENHPGAKLTDETASLALRLLKSGERPPTVARRFGVSRDCIYRLEKGETWTHLPR